MTILYEGHTISGTPEEIKEFLRLMTPVTIPSLPTDNGVVSRGAELDDTRNTYSITDVDIKIPNNQWTIYYQGSSIYDLDENKLREAMAYEHLDKLCDIETMTREEMIKFLDAYYATRR